MIILGAGLSGCLSGVINPTARIYESSAGTNSDHQAVLRFRSDAVSKQTGIPFKKVRVHKFIWWDGVQVCTPRLANMYSKKVTGSYMSRSIWNLESVDRWIAPHDFHQILAERCHDQIQFGANISDIKQIDMVREKEPVISTLPMYTLAEILNYQPIPKFSFKSIYVTRYEIEDCDVYQTVYFPDPKTPLYRATITGNNLIIESTKSQKMEPGTAIVNLEIEMIRSAFGIHGANFFLIGKSDHEQRHGKISPIPDEWRKEFILRATIDHGIFSLGRYATWRNILIDDVLEDIYVIRKLIEQSYYNLTLEMSK